VPLPLSPPARPVAVANEDAPPEPKELAVLMAEALPASPPIAPSITLFPAPPDPPVALADEITSPA
jgi:hypothetical protein